LTPLIVAICVLLLAIALRVGERYIPSFRQLKLKLQTRCMFVKLKQMATFFQIVLLLPNVYLVPYPTSYVMFLKIFAFVNINVVQLFSLGCIDGWDFHIAFVFICAFPACVYVVLAVGAVLFSLISVHNAEQRLRTGQQAFALFLLFLWCFFPFICNRVFQMFSCERFDNGQELLRADYSIDCKTDRHRDFQSFAGIMVAVYPIGVPLLFLWAMLPYRHELRDVPTRESEFAKGTHLSFFSMDYKGEYWYWELIELGRKLVLNGFLVLYNQGTILQLVVAAMVIMVHLMVIIRLQPMLHVSNNSFYPYTSFLLFVIFLASVLLQVETGFGGSVDVGYNKTLILALLFGATIGVLLLGLRFLSKDLQRASKHPLMCDRKGVVIQFKKLRPDCFHLFLR
jgi:hypothetical protein